MILLDVLIALLALTTFAFAPYFAGHVISRILPTGDVTEFDYWWTGAGAIALIGLLAMVLVWLSGGL